MSKIVAFTEPSYYGVKYAKTAYELGHQVVCIVSSEKNPKKYGYEGYYHDLIIADIKDVDSVYKAIKESKYYKKIDALIPATDYASHITAKVSELLGLKGVSFEAANRARNKDLAREAYSMCDLNVKYKLVKNYDEAKHSALEIGYPVVLKPTNCASSQSVYYIKDQNELELAFSKIKDFKTTYMGFKVRDEYLIEEYIDGKEFSVELFLKESKNLFAVVTEKLTSSLPYFAEMGHILPTSIYEDKKEQIIETAVNAALAIGLTDGPSHIEIKVSDKGCKVIEVNGRPGGDNISSDLLINALGINMFKATIQLYLNEEVDLKPTQQKAAAIAYLLAEQDGVINKIIVNSDIESRDDLVRYSIEAKSGYRVVKAKNSDDRLGFVIAVGNTPIEAKKAANEIVDSINIKYK